MSDVFISYAREDAAWAELLAGRFEERGLSVFWDMSLLAGDQFRSVIRRELTVAKAIVVLWSDNSVKSNWVLDEARVANERGVLVPAQIDDSQIPLGFGQLQSPLLIWPDRQGGSSGISALLESVDRMMGSTTPVRHSDGPSVFEYSSQRRVFLAAGVMTAFIAAGFWLTPPDETQFEYETWLGFGVMALGILLGVLLAGHSKPLSVVLKALGSAIAVGTVGFLFLLAVLQDGNCSIDNNNSCWFFHTVLYLVVVWVGITLSLPIQGWRLWRGRFVVLVLTLIAFVFVGFTGLFSQLLAASLVAALIPFMLVLADWTSTP